MTQAASSRESGVTLIELLVVLAVLAILSTLLVTGLHSAAAGWPRVTRSNADNEECQATRRMLQRLLAHIYPAKLDDGSRSVVQFDGERERIDFLAPLAQRFRTDEIVLYTLQFVDDGLRIAWRLDRETIDGEENFAPPAGEDRIRDCHDGAFSYYGRSETGDEMRWLDRWKGRDALPLLVRVRFVCRRRAEELVVAPLITAGGCASGTQAATCRERGDR